MEPKGLSIEDPISAFLGSAIFPVPLGQMILFAALVSFCFLSKKFKLGLFVSNAFIFYWAYVLNYNYFIKMFEEASQGLYFYAFLGLFMVVAIFIGFRDKKDKAPVTKGRRTKDRRADHLTTGRRKGERRKLYIKVPEEMQMETKKKEAEDEE